MKTTEPYTGPFDGLQANAQPIEKRTADTLLDAHSIFYTIQGEGPFSGTPAVFIRLAGCNLQCPMCDTEYTADRRSMTAETAADIAQGYNPGGLAVITGGEPFRQPVALMNLVWALLDHNMTVQIETNGTLPPPPELHDYIRVHWQLDNPGGVYIVVSPKTGKVNEDTALRAVCFKYVLAAGFVNPDDGLPTSVLGLPNAPARPPVGRDSKFTKPVYVQPADEQSEVKNNLNTAAAVQSALLHGYKIQLQTHKYLGVE